MPLAWKGSNLLYSPLCHKDTFEMGHFTCLELCLCGMRELATYEPRVDHSVPQMEFRYCQEQWITKIPFRWAVSTSTALPSSWTWSSVSATNLSGLMLADFFHRQSRGGTIESLQSVQLLENIRQWGLWLFMFFVLNKCFVFLLCLYIMFQNCPSIGFNTKMLDDLIYRVANFR